MFHVASYFWAEIYIKKCNVVNFKCAFPIFVNLISTSAWFFQDQMMSQLGIGAKVQIESQRCLSFKGLLGCSFF